MPYQILYNGHGRTVVDGTHSALMHVAANLFGTSDPERIRAGIDAELDEVADLVAAGLRPPLAYVLRDVVEGQRRESLELVYHDMRAAPGMSTERFSYDLVDGPDVGYALWKALREIAADPDLDVDEAAADLAQAVRDAAGRVDGFAEGRIGMLRTVQSEFGASVGTRLSVVPGEIEIAGEHAKALAELPDRVVERFRECHRLLLAVAPDRSRAPSP